SARCTLGFPYGRRVHCQSCPHKRLTLGMASSTFGGTQWQSLAIRGERDCAVKHVPSNRQCTKTLASISGSTRTVPPMNVHRSKTSRSSPRLISSSPWRNHVSLTISLIIHRLTVSPVLGHLPRVAIFAAAASRTTALNIDLGQ